MKLTRIVLFVAGAVSVFAEQNAKADSVENPQVAAKAQAIVAQAKEMSKTAADNSKKAAEAAAEGQPAATMNDMLSTCPQDIRNEFLASIAFMNGGTAGLYTGGIKKCLSPEKIEALFKAMGHQSGPVAQGTQKDQTCRCSTITLLWGCRDWKNSSCDPAFCSGSCKKEKKN